MFRLLCAVGYLSVAFVVTCSVVVEIEPDEDQSILTTLVAVSMCCLVGLFWPVVLAVVLMDKRKGKR